MIYTQPLCSVLALTTVLKPQSYDKQKEAEEMTTQEADISPPQVEAPPDN